MQSTSKSFRIHVGGEFTPESHISLSYRHLGLGSVAAGAPASNSVSFTFQCKSNADPFEIGEVSGMLDSFIAAGLANPPPGFNIQANTTVEEGFFMGDSTKLKFTFTGLHTFIQDGPGQEIVAVAAQANIPSASIVLNFNGNLNTPSDDWVQPELLVNAEIGEYQFLKVMLQQVPEPFRALALFNHATISFDSMEQLKNEWGFWPNEIGDVKYSSLQELVKNFVKLVMNENGIYLGADLEAFRDPFGSLYDAVQRVLTGPFTIVLSLAGNEVRLESDITFLKLLPQTFNAFGAEILS